MGNITFAFLMYFGLFIGVLKVLIVPIIIIGVLQYFICKKNYKLRYFMIIVSGLIAVAVFIMFGIYPFMLGLSLDNKLNVLIQCICVTIPGFLPLITSIVIERKFTKKQKIENINKMKLADL